MTRVKKHSIAKKKRKKALKETKGFRWGRKSKYKQAKEALMHAWKYKFRDRKNRKRNFRRLWQTQINAACKQRGMKYNRFIHGLKKENIQLNRKVLSTLAKDRPDLFDKVTEEVKE